MFVKALKEMEWKKECSFPVPFPVMTVRVGFTVLGTYKEDEVEFCINAWDEEELSKLLEEFFKESGYTVLNIDYVRIVRTAETMEELTGLEEGLMTAEEAEKLLYEGHSLEELAEIFSDKYECRGIYTNSCLMYPDFKKIEKSLRFYKLYEEGRIGTKKKNARVRLFVDMDGTLTRFLPQASLNDLYQKGYFLNLPPQENVVEAVKIIVKEHPEIEVFALTAFLADSGYAYMEKKAWLDAVLPQIDAAHRIFVPNGSDKKQYVRNFSEMDVLLDDHTPNLNRWAPARGIKLINDINNKNGSWKGEKVSYDEEPRALAEKIVDFVVLKKETNADRIRRMTNEELAKFLPIAYDVLCNPVEACVKEREYHGECCKTAECAMKWLGSDAMFGDDSSCEEQKYPDIDAESDHCDLETKLP